MTKVAIHFKQTKNNQILVPVHSIETM